MRTLFLLCLAIGWGVFGSDARAEEAVVLFADDFSVHEANGRPSLTKWTSLSSQVPPHRVVEVVEVGVAERFPGAEGKAMRFYKNDSAIGGVNMAITAANRFSRGAKVVTVVFDFWENPDLPGSSTLRLGGMDANNANRVHGVVFSRGTLSGVSGVYTPGARVRMRVVMNNSASAVTYDEGRATLDSDRFDVWVNDIRMIEGRSYDRGSLAVGSDLRSLQFASFGSNRSEIWVRDLRVYEGAVAPELAGEAPVFEVFLAPNGSDSNNGRSLASPILTIGRAQQILAAASPAADMRVWVLPGRYLGQKTTWTFTRPGRRIIFEAYDPDAPKPVFDGTLANGSKPGGTWLQLSFSGGRNTNLEFRNLRFENYGTAISFNGDRNRANGFNGGNVISGCYFYRIGNVFNPVLGYSTAAVRLVNSKENIIENNDFVDIINMTSGGSLHAIYAAHLSDRNFILQNRFINNSGDAVRVRDYSNDNVVLDNVYIRAGNWGYSEWYCDQDARTDCTKPTPECPSWGNEFRNNLLVSAWSGSLGVWEFFQDDSATGCAPLPGGAPRLRTSGNERVTLGAIDLWRHRNFPRVERGNSAVAGNGADPAGDGIPNLAKYYFGLLPSRPASGVLRMAVDGGVARVSFWENLEADDVEAVLERSADLRDWRTVPASRVEGERNAERVAVELRDPAPEAERGFYRLRVREK